MKQRDEHMSRARPTNQEKRHGRRAEIALAGLALAATVALLLFAPRLALRQEQEEPPKMTDVSGTVRDLIAAGDFDAAYRLLQEVDTESLAEGDLPLLAYQRAVCERRLGEPRKAHARLQLLVDEIPELESYRRLWMARALEEMGELQCARLGYQDLLSTFEGVVADSARLYLAAMLTEAGEFDKAVTLYDQQLLRATPPEAAELLYDMAVIQQQAGNNRGASEARLRLMTEHAGHRKALDMALGLRPSTSEESFARAFVLYRHGRGAEAFDEFIEKHPDHDRVNEAQYLLGRSYMRNGELDLASKTFEELYRKHLRPDALYRIGGIQVRRNRDKDAIATYVRFVAEHPEHSLADDALWQAAKAAERGSDFMRARNLFSRLADRYPDSPKSDEARWSAAFMLYCSERYRESLHSFQKAGAKASEPHIIDQSFFWAGKSAENLGLKQKAGAMYQQAAANFPRSYYSARAVSMGYEGDKKKQLPKRRQRDQRSALNAVAAKAVEEAYGVAVGELETLQRAQLLDRIGLVALAEKELSEAERENLDDTEALKLIRDCFEDLGSLDRALLVSTKIFSGSGEEEIPYLYPSYYWEQVKTAAQEAGLDPFLVLAVIRQESYFDDGAVSRAGAVGLMQIMPKTGRTLARSAGVGRFEKRMLFDPAVSIRMGSQYLGEQMRTFASGRTREVGFELGLAAYNAGPSAAHKWVRRFPLDDPDAFVERIPYKETRLYVKKVLKSYNIYKALSSA